MGTLFGTDGVRGVANVDLTPELAFRLARVTAQVLAREWAAWADSRPGGGRRAALVVGGDTRASHAMLEAAVVAGVTSVGVDVWRAGVLPTPAIAHLTRALGAAGGVVISASHNPVEDNGIKCFSHDGFKLSRAMEEEIEDRVGSGLGGDDGLPRPTGGGVGRVVPLPDAAERYVRFLLETFPYRLTGERILLDCANGAAHAVAPSLFEAIGAEVVVLNAAPDGTNINVACGSTNPEVACRAVQESGACVGFSFDGDADRVIAVDEAGNEVDGDQILAILGLHFHRTGRLRGGAVAATHYSNLGLVRALEREGARVILTRAGDRYVLEAMQAHGLILGGEKSGHVILLEHTTTGDGLLTALQLLAVMVQTRRPLSQLAKEMTSYPQVLRNVRVARKEALEENGRVAEVIALQQARLGPEGRILVRASGTEPVVRVMVEGPEAPLLEEVADVLCDVIATELNGD